MDDDDEKSVAPAFTGCPPRTKEGLDAEHRYNETVVKKGRGDPVALKTLVEAHLQNYPEGVGPKHRRKR